MTKEELLDKIKNFKTNYPGESKLIRTPELYMFLEEKLLTYINDDEVSLEVFRRLERFNNED